MMKQKFGNFIGNVIEVPSDNLYGYNNLNFSTKTMTELYNIENQRELKYTIKLLEHYTWFEGEVVGLKRFYRKLAFVNFDLTGVDPNMFWKNVPDDVRAIHLPYAKQISIAMGDLLFSSGVKIETRSVEEKDIEKANDIRDEWDFLAIDDKLREAAINASWAGTGFVKWDFNGELFDLPVLTVINPLNVRAYEQDGFIYRYDIFEKITINRKNYKILEVRELIDGKLNIFIYLDKWEDYIHEFKTHKKLKEITSELKPFWKDKELENFNIGEHSKFNTDSLLMISVANNKPDTIRKSNVYGSSDYIGKCGMMDMIDELESSLMEVMRKNKPVRYIPEHMIPRDAETGRLMKYDDFSFDFAMIRADNAGIEGGMNTILTDEPDIDLDRYIESADRLINNLILQVGLTPYTLGLQGTGLDGRDLSDRRERYSQRTRERKRRLWEPALNALIKQYVIAKTVFKNPSTKKNVSSVKNLFATIKAYHIPTIEGRADFWSDLRRNGAVDVPTMVDEIYLDKSIEQRKIMIENIRSENRLDSPEKEKRRFRLREKQLQVQNQMQYAQPEDVNTNLQIQQQNQDTQAANETTESKDGKIVNNPDKENKGDNKAKGMKKKENKGV